MRKGSAKRLPAAPADGSRRSSRAFVAAIKDISCDILLLVISYDTNLMNEETEMHSFGHQGGQCGGIWAARRFGRHGGRGPGWGPGAGGGGSDWFRVGRMLAQGDLKLLALALIAEQPRHGYELIKLIEAKTSGWYST